MEALQYLHAWLSLQNRPYFLTPNLEKLTVTFERENWPTYLLTYPPPEGAKRTGPVSRIWHMKPFLWSVMPPSLATLEWRNDQCGGPIAGLMHKLGKRCPLLQTLLVGESWTDKLMMEVLRECLNLRDVWWREQACLSTDFFKPMCLHPHLQRFRIGHCDIFSQNLKLRLQQLFEAENSGASTDSGGVEDPFGV
jgi:hypothetical protein